MFNDLKLSFTFNTLATRNSWYASKKKMAFKHEC